MYEDLKNKIANDIKTSINDNGLAKTKFKILDGLLRLRQICNSPLLLDKSLNPKHIESVKIKTLVNILEHELNDHSALVFSQFTSMLALIREELDRRNIDYAYLDGQTKDRKSAVEEFQNNDDIKLFLLSLKAGNTGLNLVKADYVYIVDPWWNPAVEAQAIDRTHRIGQDKNIFAYRMICKDSIEEKIIELQNKKKKIAKDIIVSDDNIFKSLEKRDLLGLFE
jgi:SNF2 family DNA or RNA helicase